MTTITEKVDRATRDNSTHRRSPVSPPAGRPVHSRVGETSGKSEYIALSPVGAIALYASGLLLGGATAAIQVGAPGGIYTSPLILGFMLLFYVRQDSLEPIANGTYRYWRFAFWRRQATTEQTAEATE